MAIDRILVHQTEARRIPLEAAEIFYLEADDFQTVIRLRGKQLLRDSRGLGEVEQLLPSDFLIRIHRNYIVNLNRVREIRTRKEGDGWELRLEPPVNRIIPIGRTYEARLWKAFGE